jgi:hypothetical protein
MNSTEPLRPAFRFRQRFIVLLVILCLPLCCAIGIAGYFRLSSETRALRKTVMGSVPGQWDKRFAVHVGSLTMGLVRAGSRFVNLPPEPRAALDALHGAEVGVYRLHQNPVSVGPATIFVAADKAMKARGWERIVGVVQADQLVAVYIPLKGISPGRMACCVVVLHERDLVVASAHGDLGPLLQIAEKRGFTTASASLGPG